ncbi:hypothetical protein [Spirosoma fluminis]
METEKSVNPVTIPAIVQVLSVLPYRMTGSDFREAGSSGLTSEERASRLGIH